MTMKELGSFSRNSRIKIRAEVVISKGRICRLVARLTSSGCLMQFYLDLCPRRLRVTAYHFGVSVKRENTRFTKPARKKKEKKRRGGNGKMKILVPFFS